MERAQGTTRAWKDHAPVAAGGAPARAILPVFDVFTDGAGPGLAYKITNQPGQSIIVRGKGLTGIVSADVSTDVQVGGNAGPPPGIDSIVVLDAAITINLDGTGTANGDEWGIILTDGAGNVYGAPSPLKVSVGD